MMTYLIPVFEETDKSVLTIPAAYLENFSGKVKEQVLYIDAENNKFYVLGLGKESNPSSIISIIRTFFFNAKSKLKGKVTVQLISETLEKNAVSVAQGLHLGQYEIGYLKTKSEENWYSQSYDFSFEGNINKADLELGKQLAETQMRIMKWCDAPGNYKTPQILSAWMQESAQENGFEIEIYDAKACEQMGLKALLAVGRGSIENPPIFCILKYTHPEAQKTVGLVGKGVTFDTGGVSLKPGDNMNYMKSDMGGAAAVAGTIEMAAKMKLPVNIIGAISITENCIDSYAIKPGDVIGSYLGKTIEVINTDAEGRLILADALAYITKNFETDVLIDLATLTGNAIMALGYKASAMISPNDALADALFASGLKTGEKVWRMPHWDEYKDCLKSDIADLKNLGASPAAGAVNAAMFLQEFINNHPNWAHLDVAGTAFGDSEFGSMKSASGYGVRLLLDYIKNEML